MAAPASAQDGGSVTQKQYGDRAEEFAGAQLSAGAGDSAADSAGSVGSLPFTGLDLGLMGVAAAALLAGGVLMRRRANAGQES